jgi:hypothetical protein
MTALTREPGDLPDDRSSVVGVCHRNDGSSGHRACRNLHFCCSSLSETKAVKTQGLSSQHVSGRAVLLIAKSAFAASPHLEMQRLAELAAGMTGAGTVRFAFTEQGTPRCAKRSNLVA